MKPEPARLPSLLGLRQDAGLWRERLTFLSLCWSALGRAGHFHKVLFFQHRLKGNASQAQQVDVIIQYSVRIFAYSDDFSKFSVHGRCFAIKVKTYLCKFVTLWIFLEVNHVSFTVNQCFTQVKMAFK